MVSIRSTSFVLGLLFIFLALRDTIAYTNQVREKMEVGDRISLTTEKEIFDAVPTTAEDRIGGRKIMGKRDLAKEMLNEEGAEQGASMISGATHSVGKYKHKGKGQLNVEHTLSNTSPDHPVNVKMAGFVSFSADYHVPKSHPPKNN